MTDHPHLEESQVASAVDIGALVREARLAAALTQQQLADRAGTTRQWVNRFEAGNDRASLSKVLAVLAELNLEMVACFDLSRPSSKQ